MVPLKRRTAAKAAKVCITMGWPATAWYCLGPDAPEREPVPAQGIRAQIFAEEPLGEPLDGRALAGGFFGGWLVGISPHSKIEPIHGFT